MKDKELNKNNMPAEVEVGELLNINNALAISKKFTDALKSTDQLVINHRAIKEIDLSYLQILLSLKSSIEKQGKTLTINAEEPQSMYELFESAGYKGNSLFEIKQMNKSKGKGDE